MKRIYEYITSKSKLTIKHKHDLEKRGFTEETIAKFRFISGGNQFLKMEEDIIKSFDRELLLVTGICVTSGKNIAISPMLLDDRIIIPYMDKDKMVFSIRPHKLGLKDVAIEIYQEFNVEGRDLVITEGEFKAVACMQMGIPAIAVPGIGSFSGQHFPKLIKFLSDHKVRNVCFIYDNEIKDDPKFQNYKENPIDRWDTPFYAQVMAKQLDKEGFNATIGWLPDSWRIQGKIDIDGALAQGKGREDILQVIAKAKSARVFVDDLPAEAQHIITRKMAKKYFRTHIRKEFNKYVATRRRGKTEYDEIISNFTIKIIATHDTPEGIIREMQFINEFGQTTHTFSIAAEFMASADSFTMFCLTKGNYIWRGKKEDLQNIWEGEFLNDDGRHIIEPDHIGWIDSEKIWLFGNVSIDKDGKEMRADKSHIFWTEKKGIKPLALGVSSGRMAVQEGIPYLSMNEISLTEVKKKLSDTIGEMPASLCWDGFSVYHS
jgi:DNA primase